MSEYPELMLKSGKDKAARRRHPWIYSGAVSKRPKANAGDIIKVVTSSSELLGYGFYEPSSSIICRVFHFSGEQVSIDQEFWNEKFLRTLQLRQAIPSLENVNGYRLIHSEGDFLPGLIVDIYGECASIQVRTSGADQILEYLAEFLREKINCKYIFYRKSAIRGIREEGEGWIGTPGEGIVFAENDLNIAVDPQKGQKTGFFLDQRENRMLVRKYAKGKRVLDVFCYSGGYSLNALKGEAKSVTSVDGSERAIQLCEDNVALNFPKEKRHNSLKTDAFKLLKEMESDAYDLIVLDPPAFTKHISTVTKATRGYKEINMKAIQKIAPGGLLFTFSCSQHISPDLFQKIIFGAAFDAGRKVRILQKLSQGSDHPINVYHPEGEYLKGLLLYVE